MKFVCCTSSYEKKEGITRAQFRTHSSLATPATHHATVNLSVCCGCMIHTVSSDMEHGRLPNLFSAARQSVTVGGVFTGAPHAPKRIAERPREVACAAKLTIITNTKEWYNTPSTTGDGLHKKKRTLHTELRRQHPHLLALQLRLRRSGSLDPCYVLLRLLRVRGFENLVFCMVSLDGG